jgi:alkanesulfonate monooxygenase SsuD/methylene tetrahydromethanopterin reductase-like flavin-dependent oxidoreductase (luciferase family)
MYFDLFYELSVLPEQSEKNVYQRTLLEAQRAENLGFHGIWLVEHHFMPTFSHSSAPDVFLSYLAAKTNRLRLGYGVVPLPYHHPLRVAERLGTLDLLSEGRLEVGVGRGFSPEEYQVFSQSMRDSRSITLEHLQWLKKAWSKETTIDYQGIALTVLPKPLQQPPPLWTAAASPESFVFAAKERLGVLIGPFKPWFMIEADIKLFLKQWTWPEAPRIAVTLGSLCLPNRQTAWQAAKPALEWFYKALLAQTRPLLKNLYEGYDYYHRFHLFEQFLSAGVSLELLNTLGMTMVGNAQDCRKVIEKMQKAGVTHLISAIGAGALDTELVMAHLDYFHQEIMPEYQETSTG